MTEQAGLLHASGIEFGIIGFAIHGNITLPEFLGRVFVEKFYNWGLSDENFRIIPGNFFLVSSKMDRATNEVDIVSGMNSSSPTNSYMVGLILFLT
jgi:hypothetical protein